MVLTDQEWIEIETLYKIGERPMRDIVNQYGITHGAISIKAKHKHWKCGSLKPIVNELAKASNQINQVVRSEQIPTIQQVVREKAQLREMLDNSLGDIVDLQQSIIRGTLIKLRSGDIDELQAARVLRTVGIDMSSIFKLAHSTLCEQNYPAFEDFWSLKKNAC